MPAPVRRDAFARHTDLAYCRRDPYDRCPLCGDDIFWPGELAGFDEDGRLCHAGCLEEEYTDWRLKRRNHNGG